MANYQESEIEMANEHEKQMRNILMWEEMEESCHRRFLDDSHFEEIERATKRIFIDMNLEDDMVEMFADAYNATSLAGQWEYLHKKKFQSFMFGDYPELNQISKYMKFKGHSGYTYGLTMRNIEYIAKHGKEEYKEKYGRKPACACRKKLGKRGGECERWEKCGAE